MKRRAKVEEGRRVWGGGLDEPPPQNILKIHTCAMVHFGSF